MLKTGTSWLSKGAEDLLLLMDDVAESDTHCDVLIIGSGYGGAVAAARLSGSMVLDDTGHPSRPAKIWLLERGAEHQPGDFPSRFAELAGHVRISRQDGAAARGRPLGLFDVRVGPDVSALVANGLGGGSLINAGVMERPERGVFGSDWPADITLDSLDAHYETALSMLAASPIPEPRRLPKFVTLDALLAPQSAVPCSLSIHWSDQRSAADIPMKACTLCGDCLTGCNQGAKGSLDTNYLALAHQRGVQMFCGVAVEHLTPGEPWQVTWHPTDRAHLGRAAAPKKLRARCVVLAAGTLGSTEILLRSAPQGLAVSGALGQRFSMNGDGLAAGVGHAQPVRATADQETDPADPEARKIGPTITGLGRVKPTEGSPFTIEEFAVPAGLRQVFGEIVKTLAAVRDITLPGHDPAACTDDDIQHMSLYGLMGDDGAAGRLSLPAAAANPAVEAGLRIHWSAAANLPLHKGTAGWLDDVGAALPIAVPVQGGQAPAMALTVHPLGGCGMGSDIDGGVVDSMGRVFRPPGAGTKTYAGLAVLDGAIIPTALRINPALTIAALAERAMPALMSDWKLAAAPADAAKAAPPERPQRKRRELPAADVAWMLRETMQGEFKSDAGTWWATMTVEFEEVPGFARALQLPERVLAVRRGRLALYPVQQDSTGRPIGSQTDAAPVCEAELAGSVRLFAPLLRDLDKDGKPPNEGRVTLDYRLSVQAVAGENPALLAVGARLVGVKVFGQELGVPSSTRPGIWRQLVEMDVRYQGEPVGRWSLDLGDLADRREALLSLSRQSSMPDALVDLGAIALYLLRRAWPTISEFIADGLDFATMKPKAPLAPHLTERYPGPVDGCDPTLHLLHGSAGARLSRYPQPDSALPPVLLIHGLGSSGSSFSHPSIPHNLVSSLRAAGRDVWVLDVRSSTGNEPGRQSVASADWTVDSVAKADLPAAVTKVLDETRCSQIDVVAHCMGAVMFCIAALNCNELKGRIRKAVLSQVGPLMKLGPMNRFRGYLASYLREYLQTAELDTCPDFQCDVRHQPPRWQARSPARGMAGVLFDAMLSSFPYPDDDGEIDRAETNALINTDFRRIRHRADFIFGQLFELPQLACATLASLDALVGWVKVPMLAQAIHFARQQQLTDTQGVNTLVSQASLSAGFDFPVLMIHGRLNRVFDWQGSLDSLCQLQQVRGEAPNMPPIVRGCRVHYGADSATQLALFEGYGHLDCLIGQHAHRDVFPTVIDFLAQKLPEPGCRTGPLPVSAEAPWIGPRLGWSRIMTDQQGQPCLSVKLLLQPQPRRKATRALAVVPVSRRGGVPVPDVGRAQVLGWPGGQDVTVLECWIAQAPLRRTRPDETDSFALLTLHDGVDRPTRSADPALLGRLLPDAGLEMSRPASAEDRAALQSTLDKGGPALLSDCLFSVPDKQWAATDWPEPATADAPVPGLCFALGSCQYPPGLFDNAVAGASYQRLHAEAQAADGPQFLLLAGDQVYLDPTGGVFEPTAYKNPRTPDGMAKFTRSYELNWRLPPLRHTVASLPVYPMLDDHEVSDNWAGLAAEPDPPLVNAAAALAAYRRYQHSLAPTRSLGRGPTLSYYFYPAGVPVFVLDTRSQRQARTVRGIGTARLLPDSVMVALEQRLKSAPRHFPKFIVCPSPLLPPERCVNGALASRLQADTWSGFPASASRLLRYIRDEDIRNVVLLGGDAHLSSISSFTFEGGSGNRVVSIVSSGFYTPWPFANQQPDEVVMNGPVEMGVPNGQPCGGTMALHALSTTAGYTAVRILPATARAGASLHVSLRGASGADAGHEFELDSSAPPAAPGQ